MFLYFLIVFLSSAGVLSVNLPCSINDSACLTEAAQEAYLQMIPENKALGVESSDPMHVDLIDGNLSILKFNLTDTTVKGFKDCKVENVIISQDKSQVQLDLVCPSFDLSGKYDINGRLIILPVEGNGDYHITAKTYRIKIVAEVKLSTGDDGKIYATIKNFKLDPEAIGGIVFDFKNLFHGQQELSTVVHKYANGSWKEVGSFVQLPVFNTNIKKIVKSVNKYLKGIPVENYVQ